METKELLVFHKNEKIAKCENKINFHPYREKETEKAIFWKLVEVLIFHKNE